MKTRSFHRRCSRLCTVTQSLKSLKSSAKKQRKWLSSGGRITSDSLSLYGDIRGYFCCLGSIVTFNRRVEFRCWDSVRFYFWAYFGHRDNSTAVQLVRFFREEIGGKTKNDHRTKTQTRADRPLLSRGAGRIPWP